MLKKDRSESLKKLMPAISTLYRSMATSRDAYLAQFKLSRPQLELLISLQEHGSRTTSLLAQEFDVSASAISQMVYQLIEKKLVERIEDSKDRRIANINLSSGGVELFDAINENFFNHLEQKFSHVSVKEIEHLVNIINKVTVEIGNNPDRTRL